MENTVAKFCRSLSIALLILALLCGLVLGNALGADGFNWRMAIYIWSGALVFCLLLYGVGAMVRQASGMNTGAYSGQAVPVVMDAARAQSAAKVHTDNWICKKCGTTNPLHSAFCKDCGTYR